MLKYKLLISSLFRPQLHLLPFSPTDSHHLGFHMTLDNTRYFAKAESDIKNS